ncbi:bifunctional MaoC family dehydratase N-terminal/OB-fold nucleic acid binding domain-containing protein [Streptomyces sp. NPDC058548]|uniref:bifunctional MaoC family dehydratase N-terminal/OB-fold nucleic acid binding domain-containing protein n=1 Tax=Streptomyces sp. NPDC058548 TaxID=3346545 RepID=UPI003662AF1B
MTLTRSQDGPDPSQHGLYERLAGFAGRAAATAGVGKDPVNRPMIRHWCEAMGDDHPAYRGPDAVAPPTMLQAWTMGGLSGHTDRSSAHEELFALLDGAGYTSVVATDCEQEYVRPLRPGDEVTFDTVIESVSELKTTKLGSGHFVTTRTDVHAGGQPAGTHRFRILKYAPATRPRRPEPSAGPEGTRPGAKQSEGRQPERRQLEGSDGKQPAGARPEGKQPKARRPRPVVNRDNARFWEGVAAHRLLIQRCGDCAALRLPWLPGCADCGSPEWDTVEASGAGTVYSYVVMHHPSFPAFDPPYAVGLVELAEGVRMISNVVGVPYDKVRIGMPVRLEFLRVDEELELPVFRAGGED